MAYSCYGYLCSIWFLYCNALLQWEKRDIEKYVMHLKKYTFLFAKLNALLGFLSGRHRKIQTRRKGL